MPSCLEGKSPNKILEPSKPVCKVSTEVCDGIDNDCDKEIDEEGVCESVEAESVINDYFIDSNGKKFL